MAKVIALYGAANTGKTTTLNKLIVWLGGRIDTRINEATGKPKDNSELLDVLGKKVFIGTAGDDVLAVEENFRQVEAMKADILVLASRTKGGTIDTIQNHTTPEEIVWVRVPGIDNDLQNACVLEIEKKIKGICQ